MAEDTAGGNGNIRFLLLSAKKYAVYEKIRCLLEKYDVCAEACCLLGTTLFTENKSNEETNRRNT